MIFLCFLGNERDQLILLFLWQIIEKGPIRDYKGRPLMTLTDDSNPWWSVFKRAVTSAGGKLGKPEILASTTDARYMRQLGIPALGFSPMANTPILLHDHNEVRHLPILLKGSVCICCQFLFFFLTYFFCFAVPERYRILEGSRGIRICNQFLEFFCGAIWLDMQFAC